jgi:hypothetical protein
MLRGRTYAALCEQLFMLAQTIDPISGPERGFRWETRIAEALAHRGFPVEGVPGGVRVFGIVPASGLRHQTDAGITCVDAYVLGEWKSYVGAVPKNEVLRFKATTDDLYDNMAAHSPRRPVLRLFGVAGDASTELRTYAARHGIALVERTRWPVPVLTDPTVNWGSFAGPSELDCKQLAWLSRPLQDVYPRLPDGSLRLPRPLPAGAVHELLALQERWSEQLWDLAEQRELRRYGVVA